MRWQNKWTTLKNNKRWYTGFKVKLHSCTSHNNLNKSFFLNRGGMSAKDNEDNKVNQQL